MESKLHLIPFAMLAPANLVVTRQPEGRSQLDKFSSIQLAQQRPRKKWDKMDTTKTRLPTDCCSVLSFVRSGNSEMSFAICHIIWAPCLKVGGSVSKWEKSGLAFLLGTSFFLKQYTFQCTSALFGHSGTYLQEATKHPYLVVSKLPWPKEKKYLYSTA